MFACRAQRPIVRDVRAAPLTAATARCSDVQLDGHGLELLVLGSAGDLASRRGQLRDLARGAHVLVYDTAVLDPPGSPENLYELHTPPKRIGEMATETGVNLLILGHIPPAVDANRGEVLRSIRESFKGEVRFAEDCMHVAIGGHR